MRSIATRIVTFFALTLVAFGATQIDLDTQTKGSLLPMWGGTASGTNNFTITTSGPVVVLQTGSRFFFKAANASTGACTLTVNAFSSHPIKKNGSSAIGSGDIGAGQIVDVIYDGTNFQLVGPGIVTATPPGGSSGDLQYNNSGAFGGFSDGTSHQVLHGGKTFGAVDLASADVTGTLPVANGGTGVTSAQGNGSKVQLSTGSTTTNNCGKFDANGNVVDAGVSCGGGIAGSPNYLALWNFTTPPLVGWTWDNQGGGTTDTTNGYPYAEFPTASSASQMRVLYRTAPSTPYTITAAILHDIGGGVGGTGGGESGIGIGFRDSSGKLIEFMIQYTSGAPTISAHKWTNSTTFSATISSFTPSVIFNEIVTRQPLFLQISDDGTNLAFFLSIDGQHWKQFSTNQPRTAFFASGPTQVFWGAYVNNTTVEGALISWQ